MASLTNTASIPDLLDSTFALTWRGVWDLPLEAASFVKFEDTNRKDFKTTSVHGTGSPVLLGEGDDITFDSPIPGFRFTYTQTSRALGLEITEDMMDFDLTDNIMASMEFLHQSMRNGAEVLIADLLNSAFSTSRLGGDGIQLCSTAHVREDGPTWSNRGTAASLAVASFRDGLIEFQDQRNGRGFFLGVKADKLIVPTALEFRAQEILKSVDRPDTANRAVNVTAGATTLGVWHYLTSTTAFFFQSSRHTIKCKWSKRADQMTEKLNLNRNTRHTSKFRLALGWDDPRFFWGNSGV